MRKTVATVGVAGFLLLGLAVPANAAMCVPSAGQTFIPPTYEQVLLTPGTEGTPAVTHNETEYTRTVIDTPASPAVPAVYETQTKTSKSSFIQGWTQVSSEKIVTVPYQAATETTYKDVVDNPGQPYIAPRYESVKVADEIPAKPAEGYTKYQYQKQVKGEVQTKTWIGWVKSGNFGWEIYPGVTEWSNQDVGVIAAGPHSTVISENGNTRKVSTHYQMVNNGVTQWVETKAAIPGVPAKYEDQMVAPGQPEIAPTYKSVVDVEGTAEVAEQSYLLYTHTREVKTADEVPAVAEVSHVETIWVPEDQDAPEGYTATENHRVIVDVEAVPGTDPTYGSEMTDPGQEFIAPVICEDPATPVSVTVSGSAVPTVAEQRVDVPDETLAQTGASPLLWALGALAMIGGGAWLIRRTRNA